MPPHIFDMFVQVFARIPQLVFWKWEKKDDPMKAKLPSNVKTLDWLPQQDLLGMHEQKILNRIPRDLLLNAIQAMVMPGCSSLTVDSLVSRKRFTTGYLFLVCLLAMTSAGRKRFPFIQ